MRAAHADLTDVYQNFRIVNCRRYTGSGLEKRLWSLCLDFVPADQDLSEFCLL